MIRKLKPKTNSFIINEQGKTYRVNSDEVLYMKSEGNYLILQLKEQKFTIRYKIGDYDTLIPDKLEYIRVHKSYIVRTDKISGKNYDTINLGEIEIPIGKTYKKTLKEMSF